MPVLTITSEDPDAPTGFRPEDFEEVGVAPGEFEQVGLGLDEPGFPWNVWPFSHWARTPCRDDLYLLVESQDGRRFVHDPPLCIDGDWTISD
ncbi:hypothetical protein BJF83_24660 [Nocardiopsis sp. CNR-923]|uniref:hypothetical protein n=1 Tax=Nocardiopsis sp. CNR-923 TaxID=1904965 RepID=UPI00096383C4|nr:hypothetical protein [Nocardiopsis sp. CNR-923]OLT30685.1 hypothetical protein BJF83_24660 [Nocardiopsis sp. CNR-923]